MILWVSMTERTVEMTPDEFGQLMNGHIDQDGKGYQVMYKTDDEGKITQVNLSPIGEIKAGQEFIVKVVIVDSEK